MINNDQRVKMSNYLELSSTDKKYNLFIDRPNLELTKSFLVK